ncbi:MAG: O-antigen polymerase [Olegusella sp.]|nr:O-antigen polymerase [Olegusella sp.]
MYLALIIILGALFALSLLLCFGEALSPMALVPLTMFAGCLLAYIGTAYWNDTPLSPDLVLLVFSSTSAFVLGGYICNLVLSKKVPRANIPKKGKASGNPSEGAHRGIPIELGGTYKYVLLACIVIFGLTITVRETLQMATDAGIQFSSYMEAAKAVRLQTSTVFSSSNISFSAGHSLLQRLLGKIGAAINVISIFLFAYLIYIRSKNWKLNFMVLLMAVLAVAGSLTSGGRGGAFNYVLLFILSYWMLSAKDSRGDWHFARKTLVVLASLALTLGIAFYLASYIVGRGTSDSLVSYLSFYFGCGFPSFQQFLDGLVPGHSIAGFNTFHEQLYFLQKLHVVSDMPAYGNTWVILDGYRSNVFTFVYRYYADFGWIGATLIPFISGIFYQTVYNLFFIEGAPLWVQVLACQIPSVLFDIERDAKLFASSLTVNSISIYLIIIVICTWLCLPQKKGYTRRPYSLQGLS